MIAPARVGDHRLFWTHPPPTRSERCSWWVAQIQSGWRGSRRIRVMGYDEAAQYFGVYIWEYVNVLSPLLQANPK